MEISMGGSRKAPRGAVGPLDPASLAPWWSPSQPPRIRFINPPTSARPKNSSTTACSRLCFEHNLRLET